MLNIRSFSDRFKIKVTYLVASVIDYAIHYLQLLNSCVQYTLHFIACTRIYTANCCCN